MLQQRKQNLDKPLALEKIPTAAIRMAVSISEVYREIKRGRLGPLVKIGSRSSALHSASVDAWINSRIAETYQKTTNKGISNEF